jgi:hypothetical protein
VGGGAAFMFFRASEAPMRSAPATAPMMAPTAPEVHKGVSGEHSPARDKGSPPRPEEPPPPAK